MSKAEIKARYIALARFLAESMVAPEDHDKLHIKGRWDRGQLQIKLSAPESYRGALIGRSGHTIRSLRALINASALGAPSAVVFDLEE